MHDKSSFRGEGFVLAHRLRAGTASQSSWRWEQLAEPLVSLWTESTELDLNWKWAVPSKVNYICWLALSPSASRASPKSITAGDQMFRYMSLRGWCRACHIQTLPRPIEQNDSSVRYIPPTPPTFPMSSALSGSGNH